MYEREMKIYKKFIYLFLIISFISGCKTLENTTTRIKNNLGIESSKQKTKTKNTVEIIVSCGEDNDLEDYINEGWNIKKEYSEEKICSWKAVAATKNCNIDKDKGCKIIKPDIIGEEKIYLLEK